jgi:hypothetical protein
MAAREYAEWSAYARTRQYQNNEIGTPVMFPLAS